MKKRKDFKEKLKLFLKDNWLIIIFFFLSTLFFVYQRYSYVSWDFDVYVLNAKYWLGESRYFEPLRGPLMPAILSALSIFGWTASEYIYIILVSALFAYSSAKLAKSLGMDKNLFYILSLNPYVLLIGMQNGTEILSLALFELFIAGILKDKTSGIWLGLASVARYNLMFFLPFVLLHKGIKKIAKNIALFVLPFVPWFFYNYYKFGNFFMSIADSYANNVKLRDYIHQGFNINHFSMAVNLLIPFVIIGIIYVISVFESDFLELKKKYRKYPDLFIKALSRRKADIIMAVLFILTLYFYNDVPLKNYRYLFNITIPAVYFSILGIKAIAKGRNARELRKKSFLIAAMVVVLTLIIAISPREEIYTRQSFADAADTIQILGREECAVRSNAYPMLNYQGVVSDVYPRERIMGQEINEGYSIILFYRIGEPPYAQNKTFLSQFPAVYDSENYIILGELGKCATITNVDRTYVQSVNKSVAVAYNMSIETDACNILFEGSFMRKFCNLVNLKWD